VLVLLVVLGSAQTNFFGCDAVKVGSAVTTATGTIACLTGKLGPTSVSSFACYGSVTGLSTSLTATHLHNGTSTTQGGKIVFNFTTALSTSAVMEIGTAVTFQDQFTASSANSVLQTGYTFAAQLALCQTGICYWNVHTDSNPGGEIGCVTQTSTNPISHETHTLGAESSTSPAPTSSGTADFWFGSVTTSQPLIIGYSVTVNSLSSKIIQMHIHDGSCATNACSGNPFIYLDFAGIGTGVTGSISGLVIYGYGSVTGTTGSDFGFYIPGSWNADTTIPAAASLAGFASEHAAGNLYLNIHTATNTGGELRAQLSGAAANGPAAAFVVALFTLVKLFA